MISIRGELQFACDFVFLAFSFVVGVIIIMSFLLKINQLQNEIVLLNACLKHKKWDFLTFMFQCRVPVLVLSCPSISISTHILCS